METVKDYKAGFAKGFSQLQLKDKEACQRELYKALEINNRTSFSLYKLGEREPKASQAAAIEVVFEKYGILDVWGGAE